MGGGLEDPDYSLPCPKREPNHYEDDDAEEDASEEESEGSCDDNSEESNKIASPKSQMERLDVLERKRQAEHKRRYEEVREHDPSLAGGPIRY